MRSRSPFTTAFYAIPSVHHQKYIPIRAFSMALQSVLKGESICWDFLDVWKVLTLKPDCQSVKHAIAKPFYDGVLRHPICPPPKGRPYTSISHGATVFSEGGGDHCAGFFFVLGVYRVLTLKPDSQSVKHAMAKPFYDGILCHPICPPPKGRLHTSILHGATESSEGGSLCRVFLVLGVYSVLTLKPDSQSVKHAIMKAFYDGVLRHPICPLPKGRLHTSILHGATESSEGGVIMPGFFSPGWLESSHFKDSSYVNN
ncbi:hypothetical protein B9Z19DRAFT_1090575 [Tuber borchii]|uniref:Uncharacterized protein n=1 Tax=Tuber borchii TaxID=42251 RepID=A0A2T6ZIS3_TUBBO|nr:hypothetical protein B9Z19DRAFT_1090575 [Tuber borchii]